jgi:hypothetical protein
LERQNQADQAEVAHQRSMESKAADQKFAADQAKQQAKQQQKNPGGNKK